MDGLIPVFVSAILVAFFIGGAGAVIAPIRKPMGFSGVLLSIGIALIGSILCASVVWFKKLQPFETPGFAVQAVGAGVALWLAGRYQAKPAE